MVGLFIKIFFPWYIVVSPGSLSASGVSYTTPSDALCCILTETFEQLEDRKLNIEFFLPIRNYLQSLGVVWTELKPKVHNNRIWLSNNTNFDGANLGEHLVSISQRQSNTFDLKFNEASAVTLKGESEIKDFLTNLRHYVASYIETLKLESRFPSLSELIELNDSV